MKQLPIPERITKAMTSMVGPMMNPDIQQNPGGITNTEKAPSKIKFWDKFLNRKDNSTGLSTINQVGLNQGVGPSPGPGPWMMGAPMMIKGRTIIHGANVQGVYGPTTVKKIRGVLKQQSGNVEFQHVKFTRGTLNGTSNIGKIHKSNINQLGETQNVVNSNKVTLTHSGSGVYNVTGGIRKLKAPKSKNSLLNSEKGMQVGTLNQKDNGGNVELLDNRKIKRKRGKIRNSATAITRVILKRVESTEPVRKLKEKKDFALNWSKEEIEKVKGKIGEVKDNTKESAKKLTKRVLGERTIKGAKTILRVGGELKASYLNELAEIRNEQGEYTRTRISVLKDNLKLMLKAPKGTLNKFAFREDLRKIVSEVLKEKLEENSNLRGLSTTTQNLSKLSDSRNDSTYYSADIIGLREILDVFSDPKYNDWTPEQKMRLYTLMKAMQSPETYGLENFRSEEVDSLKDFFEELVKQDEGRKYSKQEMLNIAKQAQSIYNMQQKDLEIKAELDTNRSFNVKEEYEQSLKNMLMKKPILKETARTNNHIGSNQLGITNQNNISERSSYSEESANHFEMYVRETYSGELQISDSEKEQIRQEAIKNLEEEGKNTSKGAIEKRTKKMIDEREKSKIQEYEEMVIKEAAGNPDRVQAIAGEQAGQQHKEDISKINTERNRQYEKNLARANSNLDNRYAKTKGKTNSNPGQLHNERLQADKARAVEKAIDNLYGSSSYENVVAIGVNPAIMNAQMNGVAVTPGIRGGRIVK